MIKATIRANAGTAANDAVRQSGRPALVHLDAFRASEAPCPDDHPRALLARVAAGDPLAFEELYRLLSRRVYAFALRMTGNAEAAEEVTADTMHEVWRTAGRFRCDAKVSTWVLGIARNKALMTLRNAPRGEHVDIGDYADILDAGVPDGFAVLSTARDRELIRRCLQGLSVDHRECLHLAFYDDMSVQEMATLLDIPEGTVKSRLWHAKAQLAARISAIRRQPHLR